MLTPRKLFWLALAGITCLALLLLLLPAKTPLRKIDLRIVGGPQATNGSMLISFVLSNGTSRVLNIVDDSMGDPFLVLDEGTEGNMPGTIGTGVGRMANTLKLNLAAGASLTNTVTLTNPPSRFRLLVEVRDLRLEHQRVFQQLLRALAEKARIMKAMNQDDSSMLPTSPWIENGKISTNGPRIFEESQGDSAAKPRVASSELPWEKPGRKPSNPERVAAAHHLTPSQEKLRPQPFQGWTVGRLRTQGSLASFVKSTTEGR